MATHVVTPPRSPMNQQVANILWIVRMLRLHLEAEYLTREQVYAKQRLIFFYDLDTVEDTLREIQRRGFHWDATYRGIPDMCIVCS